MRCNSVRKNMFLFFENKLKPKKRDKIAEHLKGCAWCMTEYKKGEHVLNVMRGGYPKEVPEGLHKSIMQEVYGLKSYNEEHKKEVKFMFGTVAKRSGLVFAAILTVCVLMTSVPFDVVKEKGLDGINYIANSIQDNFNKKEKAQFKSMQLNEESVAVEDTEPKMMGLETKKENTSDKLDEQTFATGASDYAANINAVTFDTAAVENEDALNISATTTEKMMSFQSVKIDDANAIVENESFMNMKTSKLDEVLSSIKELTAQNNADMYSKVITYRTDEYRNADIKIKIRNSDLDKFKQDLSSKYKIESDSEEKIDNTKQIDTDKELLDSLKQNKTELETRLTSTIEQTEKENLTLQITNIDTAISELELKLNSEDMKIARINMTIEEVSELDEKGIINASTFFKSAAAKFSKGTENFVRVIQDALLWICENILAIVFYSIVFIIVYSVLKFTFENFNK